MFSVPSAQQQGNIFSQYLCLKFLDYNTEVKHKGSENIFLVYCAEAEIRILNKYVLPTSFSAICGIHYSRRRLAFFASFLFPSLSPSDWLACSLWLAGMGALASIAYIPKRDWIEEREKGAIADSKKRT